MPSRRISADDRLAPVQEIAISPYSSYNSDNVNMLTRIVSGERHKDFIVNGLDLLGSSNTYGETVIGTSLAGGGFANQTVFDTWWNSTNFVWDSVTQSAMATIPSPDTSVIATLQQYERSFTISDIGYWYKIIFTLANTPKKLYIQLGSETYYYDHPESGTYTAYIQLNNENGVFEPLTFSVHLDDFDTYSDHSIYIDTIVLSKVITRGSDIEPIALPYDANNQASLDDANIPEYLLHPHESIKITPGVAIKDEVMLNMLGINPSDDPALTLTYDDEDSWIHGDPFESSDFVGDVSIYTDGNVLTSSYVSGLLTDDYAPLDDGEPDGQHDGSDGASVLSDSSKNWGTNELVGMTIFNLSGYHGEITSNTATTITTSTSSFTWDTDDEYSMTRKVAGDESKVKWAYICIYYSYFKNPEPNKAYIGLVREENVNDVTYGEDYLVLGKLRFVDINTVDAIIYYPYRSDWGFIDATNVTYLKMNQLKHWENKPLNTSLALDLLAERIYNYKGVLYFQTHEMFKDWIGADSTSPTSPYQNGLYSEPDNEKTLSGTGHGPYDYLQWLNGIDDENGHDLLVYIVETNSFWKSRIITTGEITDAIIIDSGLGLTDGTYTNVSFLTPADGYGSGATADIIVSGNSITSVTINSVGAGYKTQPKLDTSSFGGDGTVLGDLTPDFDTYDLKIVWEELEQKRFELNWSTVSLTDGWPTSKPDSWVWYENGTEATSQPTYKTFTEAKDAWPASYYTEQSTGPGEYTVVNPFNPEGRGMVPGPLTDGNDVKFNKFLRADGTWQPSRGGALILDSYQEFELWFNANDSSYVWEPSVGIEKPGRIPDVDYDTMVYIVEDNQWWLCPGNPTETGGTLGAGWGTWTAGQWTRDDIPVEIKPIDNEFEVRWEGILTNDSEWNTGTLGTISAVYYNIEWDSNVNGYITTNGTTTAPADLDTAKSDFPKKAWIIENTKGTNGGFRIVNPYNPRGNGLVPGPTSEEIDDNKFLRSDGKWESADNGYRYYLHGWPQTDMIVGKIIASNSKNFIKLAWHIDYAPGSTDLTFDILVNGVQQDLAHSYTIPATSGNDSKNSETISPVISVIEEDVISIKITQTGTAPNEGGNDLTISLY